MTNYARVLWGPVVLWMWTATGFAGSCTPWVARAISVQGTVEVQHVDRNDWSAVKLQEVFCAGDRVRAGIYSRAALLLQNETLLRLDQETTLVLPQLSEEENAWLELGRGALHFISNIPYRLKINTPFVNAAIEGTEFAVRVSANDTRVWVVEGQVLVENSSGNLSLGPGQTAITESGKAPAPYLKITPKDAVQWALYYPPIIDYRPKITSEPRQQQAIDLFRRGQISEAIETLNSVPETARDHKFFTLRAALLLSIGQVETARSDIMQALAISPESGGPIALQSIIELTRNDKEKARSLAEQAIKLEPQSPTPRIAMSYAQQANFDLEGAKESIQEALEFAPDDPLAWSRLSELQLSTGELDEALESAKKAETLDPELAHTHMILGFAQLLRIEVDEAKESFAKAIELDPSAPLPRLGMGLAKIRQGDVEEGRQDIEVAAVLDPENSIVRSYLGKAYFEEKRPNVASREFDLAKRLDPKDPTPWFYDAVQKLTTNRPVEALHDAQKAIALNGNRAVYRSSLLLDDDLAARSSALGRIYNELGFQQRGVVEGWRSVTAEPDNYSAHRLLADTYIGLPRHEIARVSELLQSQLLQPINITPLQPNLAESNLLLLAGSGPSSPAFNEFNPLFARNRLALQGSGVVGTNDTFGDEVTQSGLWNRFSYSLGQLHYQTEGFRQNNGFNINIYNAFFQAALLPELSIQAEYRHRDGKTGELGASFSPDVSEVSFQRDFHTSTNSDKYRLGLNGSFSKHAHLLLSANYINDDQIVRTSPDFPATNVGIHGHFTETQFLYQNTILNLITGGGYYQLRQNFSTEDFLTNINIEHTNAYLYSITKLPPSIAWTIGLSGDVFDRGNSSNFDDDPFSNIKRRINPKFGMFWNIIGQTVFRAAWFTSLKRSIFFNQGLEPTQVAGFNQFFDDPTGTSAERWGVGLDFGVGSDLTGGLEYSQRYLSVPLVDPEGSENRWKESFYRAYIQLTHHSRWAMKIEYSLENFDNLAAFGGPLDTDTQIVPISISYFHPTGFFAIFGANYFNQKVKLRTGTDHDDAVFLNLNLGYRLPKRWGIFEIRLQNLLNQAYRYQGLQDRRPMERFGIPSLLPFPPEFTAYSNLTLSF
ncbi:MAG: FecR domain-containing protein [Gammaproteobacteria bacterium]